MQPLGLTDISIVLTFLAMCLGIGLYNVTKIKTLKEFALSYPNISVTVLFCAIFSSSIGAGSTIGITGKVYEFGVIFVIKQLFIPLVWGINAVVIGANITRFQGCISLSEIMYRLYGSYGRAITAFAAVISSLGAIAAQALALGWVFHHFLGLDTAHGIFIGYGIITIYAALGGIQAVIPTEIFKSAVILFVVPISYIVVFATSGGMESLLGHLPESHLKITLSDENISLLASFVVIYLLPSFSPALIQRCLMAKSAMQLKLALKIIALISIPVSLVFCVIAYKMRASFPELSSDVALLYFISLLPNILRGLMVTGLIAIIMSMAEANINATSVIIVNDVLKVIYPKLQSTTQVMALRITTVVLSLTSVILIQFAKNILDLVWFVANFWDPIISIPALIGFIGFRTTSKSFIASVFSALCFILIGRLIIGEFSVKSWSLGILGSILGLFGMHYYQLIRGQIASLNTINTTLSLNLKAKRLVLAPIKYFNSLLQTCLHLITENPGAHTLKIKKFAIFALSYYFLYSLEITNNHNHLVFAYLLIIGYFFCIVLLFREFIASKLFLEKYLHYYWYFLLTFCLPFVSTYMLLINISDPFWVMNGMLSAFSLYLFVDARRFLLLYSIGAACGFALLKIYGADTNVLHETTTITYIAYIYLFFLFTSLFFFRTRELEHEEKIATMELFGGAMAHEVRTPLAGLKMCADTLQNIVNDSTVSSKDGKPMIQISQGDVPIFLKLVGIFAEASTSGINTVDRLLRSLKHEQEAADTGIYHIKDIVESAMQEYLTFHPERNNAEVNIKKDFKFYGSKTQLILVLINLLNNAYKYAGQGAKIKVWTENNKLYFTDYGKGISEENLPKIFDKFYTQAKGGGTGIGLAYCKQAMQDMGGNIECHSTLGQFTEFILSFPKIKATATPTT